MPQNLFYRNQYLMHSRFELYIPETESEKLESLFNEMVYKIEKLENSISKFIDNSETSLLNKNAAINPVKVTDSFFSFLELAQEYYHQTCGFFDITAGSIHQSKGNGIKLDKTIQSVNFESVNISIDFGAIGKGLSLEKAVEILKTENIQNALLVFGDSSVYALGINPLGDSWPFKISNGNKIITLNLRNKALSSSGLHNHNNQLVPHIIDPFTTKVLDKNEKVVVISDCPVRSEILSTALYAADEKNREIIKSNFLDDEIYIL